MNRELYRREVIDYQKDKLNGEIILTQPISNKVWIYSVYLFAFLTTLLFIFGSYTRKETVQGYVVPSNGLVEIYSQRPGVIVKTFVAIGDSVLVGQPLFEISNERAIGNGDGFSETMTNSMNDQMRILEDKIENLELLKEKQKNYFIQQLNNSSQQLEQLQVQLAIQGKHVNLLSSRITSIRGLRKDNYISEDLIQNRDESLLVEQKNYEQLKQSIIQVRARILEYEVNLNSLELEYGSQKDDLNRLIIDIEQRKIQQADQNSFTIVSSTSGTIENINFFLGQNINTQIPAIVVLPEKSIMQAELFIPTRAIGFVKKGTRVEIRYEAFPYERYGFSKGKISSVARTILSPEQIVSPFTLREAVYRSTVALETTSIYADGEEYSIQSGMKLEATLHLESRPLYEWILKPAYSLRRAI